ncbi:MAG: hypothetical protein RLN81_05815 [Balneolaceae bacterium]
MFFMLVKVNVLNGTDNPMAVLADFIIRREQFFSFIEKTKVISKK